MSKFFIPGVDPDDLYQVWEEICRKFGSWAGYRVTKRHIRRISYLVDGAETVSEVGVPDGENQIVAICETLEAYVCVRHIDLTDGDALQIPRDLVTEVELFDSI